MAVASIWAAYFARAGSKPWFWIVSVKVSSAALAPEVKTPSPRARSINVMEAIA
jgi:hypothetical protein